MKIEFTEEMILNPGAMPEGCEQLRAYRQEIFLPNHHFPVELGKLYLPPTVDISDIEELIDVMSR